MAIIESESQNRLVDRINGTNILSFSDWLYKYQEALASRELKEKTLKDYTGRISTFREHFNDTPIRDITTKDIAEFLNGYTSQGKAASAKLFRSTLLDIFREAIAEGYIQTNPVESTRNPRVEIKRERLSLEVFRAIRLAAEQFSPWVALSLDLALITGQRMGDIRKMRWDDIHDGKLWVVQEKTGMKVAIPTATGLSVVDMDLQTVILRCQKSYGTAETLIASRKHEALAEKTISKWFAKARLSSGVELGDNPPSFHEIRSLAARLYTEEKSSEFAQRLLGHKSAAMTAKYQDSRGSEWVDVTV